MTAEYIVMASVASTHSGGLQCEMINNFDVCYVVVDVVHAIGK